MKIKNPNVRNWDRISVNGRRNKDGSPSPGVVITQRRAFILATPDEWEEIKRAGDIAIQEQETAQIQF